MQPWFGMTVFDISEIPHYALEKVARVRGDSSVVIKEVMVIGLLNTKKKKEATIIGLLQIYFLA